MHFDVVDLRLFVHIAELGNLTRGAERAALSPAAASARLKSLESRLQCRLFYRSSRGLTLTAGGETLLRHARVILRQFEHVRSDFSDQSGGATGHLRIYANTTSIFAVLPAMLAKFMAERPEVTVDLQEHNTREVVRGVLDTAADLGVVGGSVPASELQSLVFDTDRLVVVTPASHPLGARAVVAFEETMDFPHVGLQNSTLSAFLEQVAAQLNRSLKFRVMMSGFEGMCLMIEAGVGIGILPQSATSRLAPPMDLRVVQLSDYWAYRERRVLFRDFDALPGCARAFVKLLAERGNSAALDSHPPASSSN